MDPLFGIVLLFACISGCRFQLYVKGGTDDCDAVAAALNSLEYGSSSISGVYCVSAGISTVHYVPKPLDTILYYS